MLYAKGSLVRYRTDSPRWCFHPPWQTVLKVAYRDDEYGTLHTLFSSVIADEFLDEEL